MEPKEKITAIRQRLVQADTEGALRELLTWLEQAPPALTLWSDTVRSLKSRYRRTKREKQQGTITYEQAQLSFNQIESSLLDVLHRIEQGEKPVLTTESSKVAATSAVSWLPIGVVTALALAAVSIFLLRDLLPFNTPISEPKPKPIGDCPPYPQDSRFNIMVLPYKPLRGERESIEGSIKDRLALSIEQYKIPAYVMTREIDVTNANLYPSDAKGARLLGAPCQAQLVIWGTTERTPQNQLITTTSFRFLNKEHFNLTDFTLDQNAEVDTLETISSIATEGVLTENIEAGIRLIFGLVAHETGQYAVAANLIQEACDSLGGVTENPKWGMVLADSYVRSDQLNQAIATYDAVLAANPDDTQALAQRGFLTYKLQEYAAAEAAFTEVLARDTSQKDIWAARAAARVRSNQLYEAEQDLKEMERQDLVVPKGIKDEYFQRQEILQKNKAKAEAVLRRNPNDTLALRIQAETAQQLGDFVTASKAASRILVRDPNRVDALKTLMEVKPMLEDTEKVHQLIERSRTHIPESRLPRIRTLTPRTPAGGR